MAKKTNNIMFTKATIDFEEHKVLITEVTKDDTKTFDLLEVLREYDGVEGIKLTISQDKELTPKGC